MAAATALFPGARIARMDGETLKPRGAAERIYRALRDHEIDLLVGTQVIAKGIDIPGITTIGVVNADTALLLPDFRAAERTFQLLCQVAGPRRSRRAEGAGDHPDVRARALRRDVRRAPRPERVRAPGARVPADAPGYPPFGSLLRLVFQGEDPLRVEAAAHDAARRRLAKDATIAAGRASLLGPAPCPILKIRNLHRWHLIVKARESEIARRP